MKITVKRLRKILREENAKYKAEADEKRLQKIIREEIGKSPIDYEYPEDVEPFDTDGWGCEGEEELENPEDHYDHLDLTAEDEDLALGNLLRTLD